MGTSSRSKIKTSSFLVRLFYINLLGIGTDFTPTAGEVVLDGTDFRNGAHLRFKADLFVPCGGRLVHSLYEYDYLDG